MKVFQIPVLQDNYIYILHDNNTNKTAVVDPAIAQPVQAFLEKNNWQLDYIFNTHHHPDHVGGNFILKKKWNCQVIGFSQDAHRIPCIDKTLDDNDEITFGSHTAQILFVPGHTLGHIAYWFSQANILFCGDTLFAMGCGRLFEGTPKQMFHSLQRIKQLPAHTTVYCTHEYTEKNGRFALREDPHNIHLQKRMKEVINQRKNQQPTVPFPLSAELQTNPFLRSRTVAEFTRLREKRDYF